MIVTGNQIFSSNDSREPECWQNIQLGCQYWNDELMGTKHFISANYSILFLYWQCLCFFYHYMYDIKFLFYHDFHGFFPLPMVKYYLLHNSIVVSFLMTNAYGPFMREVDTVDD